MNQTGALTIGAVLGNHGHASGVSFCNSMHLCAVAGNNEIDEALIDLLQQNIDAAKAAGQKEPAEFMEKVRDAARKFVIKV
jgi:hypothetical protein